MRLTPQQAREMPIGDVVREIRLAAATWRDHGGITYDSGMDLITLVLTRGDEIADAIEAMTRQAALGSTK